MSNRVVHFEIPSDDPDRSMVFFKEIFNWDFQQFGDVPYWLIQTGKNNDPGINGGLMKKRDPGQPVVLAIDVTDLDATIERISNAGGQVVVQKTPIPGVGWQAFFKDPDGNIHGIYQNDPDAQ